MQLKVLNSKEMTCIKKLHDMRCEQFCFSEVVQNQGSDHSLGAGFLAKCRNPSKCNENAVFRVGKSYTQFWLAVGW